MFVLMIPVHLLLLVETASMAVKAFSRPPRNFNTIVKVDTRFKQRCSNKANEGVSLSDYMRLPVEQYVCLALPLDAHLERINTPSSSSNNLFALTVPPVSFFHLSVSPKVYCNVTQDFNSVVIESNECILSGSPYVESLNGCYKFHIRTVFKWEDRPGHKVISSTSKLHVAVDPPPPFDRIPRPILERTGALAMNTAINIIEREFVKSLSLDYRNWATNARYRQARALYGGSNCDAFPTLNTSDEVEQQQDLLVESSGRRTTAL